MQAARDKKFIFITGGVVSSIGKGLSAASLAMLLEARGLRVGLMKCDPYLNVDPGTMSPFQHGEVYVTEDGAETDLDLGHYERFTRSCTLSRHHSLTAGQVYEHVLSKERRGEYLGRTVQVIPHITDEIKRRIFSVAHNCEVLIVEIGGTVGDIEGQPFIEAIRQIRTTTPNTLCIHLTHVPYIASADEMKSKPTQHSVKELRAVGVQPDFLICRSSRPISSALKEKIALFCSVPARHVIAAQDAQSIYEVPLSLQHEGLDAQVVSHFSLSAGACRNQEWVNMVHNLHSAKNEVTVALVGKYVHLKESYCSIKEALIHGGLNSHIKVNILYIDSDDITPASVEQMLAPADALLVPGGFGLRGQEGKIQAIRYARTHNLPFLGICLGMQLAMIEFARSVCGLTQASSREFFDTLQKQQTSSALDNRVEPLENRPEHRHDWIIDVLPDQKALKKLGGTMRLGAYPCALKPNSQAFKIYNKTHILERHRHRYEFNNKYKHLFEQKGMCFSGLCEGPGLVEIAELPSHPWFIGVQFHPEFKSKPLTPHPLFKNFIEVTAGASPHFIASKKTKLHVDKTNAENLI